MRIIIDMPVFSFKERQAKQTCLKVLEEASELCEAAKEVYKNDPNYMGLDAHGLRDNMLSELADVMQTLVNLKETFNITDREINKHIKLCVERNEKRGRY